MIRSFLYSLIGISAFLAMAPSGSHADWDRRLRQSNRYWQRDRREAQRYWRNRWERKDPWAGRRHSPYRHGRRFRTPYRGGIFIGPYGVTW